MEVLARTASDNNASVYLRAMPHSTGKHADRATGEYATRPELLEAGPAARQGAAETAVASGVVVVGEPTGGQPFGRAGDPVPDGVRHRTTLRVRDPGPTFPVHHVLPIPTVTHQRPLLRESTRRSRVGSTQGGVSRGGVEPPRPCGHRPLKPARLPFRHLDKSSPTTSFRPGVLANHVPPHEGRSRTVC